MPDWGAIRVRGARENNLKNVSLDIPKRRLTVFTGVSGSGKSSLVFETIAAESKRLINETYSAFVQGFMPTLARPDVDSLEGLTTAIILDQERMGANVRSTVGTVTDASAMLRVVFSRVGKPHIGGPQAFSFNVPSVTGGGAIKVDRGSGKTESRSFSIAGGMCPRCEGMGSASDIDLTQLYDETRSLADGAITVPGYTADGWSTRMYSESGFLDPDKPIRDFTETELKDFLYKEPIKVRINGINLTYEGLVPKVQKSMLSKDVDALQPHIRAFVDRAVTFSSCPDCGGTRLNEAARSSKIKGISIADACAMQISDLAEWVRGLDEPSVGPLLAALGESLDSFVEMGLGYLSLDRPSGTLSGGEAQRTRMIRHLGSALTDVTYVFDEPTIGLHAHDVERMNALLRRLRDKGNTVLVVEHDAEVIRVADHVVDMGPAPVPAAGRSCSRARSTASIASGTATGRHLDVRQELKPEPRAPRGSIPIRNARLHNLKDVSVDVPLGVLVAVTGVAGSGKSSLIHGCLPRTDPSVTVIDQSAIRGSRRSNPATYTGILDPSGRRSRRRTASSRPCSARTRKAPARTATASARPTPASASWPRSSACARCARAVATPTTSSSTACAAGTSSRRWRCRSRRLAASSPRSRSASCSTAWPTSGWATSRSARSSTRCRAASASGSSSRSRCPATPRSTSSTSRRPGSTCRTSTTSSACSTGSSTPVGRSSSSSTTSTSSPGPTG